MRSLLSKTLLSSIVALALLAAAPASARPPELVQVDQRDLLEELRSLQAQVQALQSQMKKGREGRDMRRGLDAVSAGIAKVEAAVRSARPAAPVRVERHRPQIVPGPTAMDAPSFAALRKSVSGMSFAGEKMVVIETALRSNWLTVDQGKMLLSEFRHGSDKLDALKAVWPRVVDRENGFRFYEDFTFESEKRTAKTIIDG